jgi:uncharacterized protein YqeY
MFPQEESPSGEKTGPLTLSPTVWEKMREQAQEVAQRMEERVRQALADGQHREAEVLVGTLPAGGENA